MLRQELQKISHSALTNHRIIAVPNEPFPEAAFHMTRPSLRDVVHVDAVPGKNAPPAPDVVLLNAHGELMVQHPEYKPRYQKLLESVAKTQPHNPAVLSALGRRAVLDEGQSGLAEGLKYISQAGAQGSTVASDYELYASLLVQAGQAPEPVAVLKHGIDLNPYATRLYKRLALVYIQLHDDDHALQTMKQELKVFPEDDFMRMLVAKVEGSASPPSN